jgi:hypothetical protein
MRWLRSIVLGRIYQGEKEQKRRANSFGKSPFLEIRKVLAEKKSQMDDFSELCYLRLVARSRSSDVIWPENCWLHKITLEVVFLLTPPLPCQQGISACGAAIKSVKVLNSTHYTASQTGIEKMCLSTVKKNPGTSYLDGQKKGKMCIQSFFKRLLKIS